MSSPRFSSLEFFKYHKEAIGLFLMCRTDPTVSDYALNSGSDKDKMHRTCGHYPVVVKVVFPGIGAPIDGKGIIL